MELQVLVATMQQNDLSLVEKMNLRQNVIITNQCGRWKHEKKNEDFGEIQMLSSATKGVGKNRNLALSLATADILLFADDDITYYDADLHEVITAFHELPDADVIFFGIDMTKNGEVFDKRRNKVKRLRLYNSLKYGACRMAVRRTSVEKAHLSFSTLFGGGCEYGHGEDSIFICDCLRAGLHLYSHSYVLGACSKDSSTWFSGYDEKYFMDVGALTACAFPKTKHLIKWYFVRKMKKLSGMQVTAILSRINEGIAAFESRGKDTVEIPQDRKRKLSET